MSVNLELNTITSGYNLSKINTNFNLIKDALEDAVSRTGDIPNSMEADLDMNGNDILNLNSLDVSSLSIGGVELVESELFAKGDRGDAATISIGSVGTGNPGSSATVTNVGSSSAAVLNFTIPRGDVGSSGAGSGDMISTQNLNDLANKATGFNNIKQSATTSATGVVELATSAETITGTDTVRAITPAGLAAVTTNLQPKDTDLTTIAGLTATTDNFIQSKSSAWSSRTPTQVTADLIPFIGDSGSGGTKGLVPVASAGDAAAGKVLGAGGGWVTQTASSGFTILTKPADENRTTTTFTNDANLAFSMLANTTYRIRSRIFYYQTNNNNRNFKFGWSGPSSPTLVDCYTEYEIPGPPATTKVSRHDVDYYTVTIAAADNFGSGYVQFEAIIQNGANAGTFAFQWGISSSDDTAVIRKGTVLEYMVI